MGSGGFIPSDKKQYVTFFNTTGVIEKDKNMFYAPRFNSDWEDETVSDAFYDMLTEVCPPSSAYTSIELTGWSPEDRTLVVRGNIDDFRVITDTGACLNYLIVTRRVEKKLPDESTIGYYYKYAFFITGVEQVGGASIKVSVEPDDFTNVFYLHNLHQLTSMETDYEHYPEYQYEPFNERMKNCYVNRQHYDRVSVRTRYYVLYVYLRDLDAGFDADSASWNTISIQLGDSPTITGTLVGYDDREYSIADGGDLGLYIRTSSKVDIDPVPQNMSSLTYNGNDYYADYYSDVEWRFAPYVKPTNQRIFLNQEESFKFKYQYRDQRRPFGFSDLFYESEMREIENAESFSDLNVNISLQKKIIKCCIQYLVFEMKSQEKFMRIDLYINSDLDRSEDREFSNNIKGLQKSTTNVFFPFINVPDFLSKFESYLSTWTFKWKLRNQTGGSWYSVDSATRAYRKLNKNALADFVFGAYVVGDVGITDSMIDFDFVNKEIHFTCNEFYGNTSAKDLYIVPINDNDPLYSTRYIKYVYTSVANLNAHLASSVSYTTTGTLMALMLSQYDSRDYSINVYDEKLTGWDLESIRYNYIDPVLEAEPYSFYSLSYLAYEMPFNKNRYYSDMKINFTYYISINGGIKLSYIPSYKVENKEFRYYNESLIFTIPSSLPMVSDSYSTYYYQNQAQMKNQFAVNEYNRGVDLAQHFFISGPNAVGMSATKKGWVGAVSETGNQLSQMTNELLDIGQSNKTIEMNQKAKLADMGARPDVVKQSGSDVFSDLITTENRPFFNHYTIDSVSYRTIAKFFERFGYQINLYDKINAMNRIGWNFVKLNSFDWNPEAQYDIMVEQENSLGRIFSTGVTLLHDKTFLTDYHNYEIILAD